jgi:hypothetical protein
VKAHARVWGAVCGITIVFSKKEPGTRTSP